MTDFTRIDSLRASISSKNGAEVILDDMTSAEPAFAEVEDTSIPKGESFKDIFGFTPKVGGFTTNFHFPFKRDYVSDEMDVKYYPDKEKLTQIALAFKLGLKVLMVGPPGCGKTEMARFLASKLGYPFFRFNFRGDMTPDEILGRVEVVAEDGVPVTKGKMGEFVRRVQEPGIILCDEVMRMHPATAMALQPLFEKRGELRLQHMDGDVVIKKHEDCHILLADNTHGTGDGIEKYASNSQDQAFLNRIEMTLRFDYPTEEVERKMAHDYAPAISDHILKKMVKLGRLMRTSWSNGEVSLPFTPRTLQTYAQLTEIFKNPAAGFLVSYIESLPDEEERMHAKQAASTVFGSEYPI